MTAFETALTFPSLVRGGDIVPIWAPDGRTFAFVEDDAMVVVDPDSGARRAATPGDTWARVPAPPPLVRDGFLSQSPPVREVRSPDGRWFATEQGDDLWLRNADDGRLERVTDDGTPEHRWDVEMARWSPDGATLALTRVDNRGVDRLPIVRWLETPERVDWFPYVRTGGPHPRTELHLVDVAERVPVRAKLDIDELFWLSIAGWLPSGEALVLTADRFDKVLALVAVEPATGATRLVVEERQDTFVYGIRTETLVRSAHVVRGTSELIWLSERDGWRHAYRYAADGTMRNRLSAGEWEVDRVIGVAGDHVYLLAHVDLDRPYDVHLCAVGLDGTGFRQVSVEPGVHDAVLAPSGDVLVDRHSSLDRPPRTDLRRTADGTLIATVAEADVSALDGIDLGTVEELRASATDGATELHGAIWHPPGFDPSARHAVIELVYGGPQNVLHPRDFRQSTSVLALALAQLGFVVFTVDGPGTPERGKAFQDVVYGRFGQHEVAEHVGVLDQLLAARPYLDRDRVGIVGGSWGGYMTLRALVTAPDRYRAGVCIYGVGDLVDHLARAIEPYMGDIRDNRAAYEAASSLDRLDDLQADLLLVHGTADVNATFSATMKIVDRLIQANKRFDLLAVPEMAHGMLGSGREYTLRRVGDFFATHLKGSR